MVTEGLERWRFESVGPISDGFRKPKTKVEIINHISNHNTIQSPQEHEHSEHVLWEWTLPLMYGCGRAYQNSKTPMIDSNEV